MKKRIKKTDGQIHDSISRAVVRRFVEQKNKQVHLTKQKLEEKNKKLEQLNRDLSILTFISSHDLQEPLRKLQLVGSILEDTEGENLSESGRHYLNMMLNASGRIRELIRDLQEYSETSVTAPRYERVDLNEVLEDVRKILQTSLQEKKARIYKRRLCKPKGSFYQLRKLVRDIIINSIRFAKEDVPPRIFVKSEIKLGSELGCKELLPTKKYCHLSFSDNGIGFDPKYNEHVFDVFRKLSKSEGTGIGLAICKKITENHNGHIRAEGILNKGTTIHVYLPY